jgi:hypothetical protein
MSDSERMTWLLPRPPMRLPAEKAVLSKSSTLTRTGICTDRGPDLRERVIVWRKPGGKSMTFVPG